MKMEKKSLSAALGRGKIARMAICLSLLLAIISPAATAQETGVLRAASESTIAANVPNAAEYFIPNETWYRDFAPGILNPNEGTIEMTVRLDKPYEEFGDWYDFLFRVIPEQGGPGNTLINAHIPRPISKPTGSTYEQPLTFFVKNGSGNTGAFAYAQPASLSYTVGQSFNLAFAWKLGPNGYVAIYKDGIPLVNQPTSIDSVQEKFMPYEFTVERGSPFNVSNLKISTRAIAASELETGTVAFSRDEDTSLLGDISLNQPAQTEKFTTPWHASSGYNVVKPAFRNDKQVFTRQEEAVYPVMTVNYGTSDRMYDVSVKATDPEGVEKFTETRSVTVPADGQYRIQELPLPELAGEVGFWYLETTVSSVSSDAIVYKSAIAKLPDNDSSVADGAYADYYGTHSDYKDSMTPWARINTSATRAWEDSRVFLWYAIEPEQGQYTWEHADQYVDAANDAGIDVLAVLGNPPNWASTRPPVSAIPEDGYASEYQFLADRYVSRDILSQNGVPGEGDDWSDYVYQTMKRYAGKVKYFEIGNEANFHPPYLAASFSGTKAEYFRMLAIAHEQAERVKAEYLAQTGDELELYISTSGFTPVAGDYADRQMTIDALQEPYVGYYDIFNIHGYTGTSDIKNDVLAAYLEAKANHPDLQLWQGEFFPMNDTFPDVKAKLYGTVDKYLDFLSNGFDKYFTMGQPSENTFVNRFTLSPTEVFQTTAVLQNEIRKVDAYVGSYSDFPKESLLPVKHYMLRTDGNYLSVLSANSQPMNVLIGNANQILRVVDTYGNDVPVQADGSVFRKNTLFIVSSEPLQIAGIDGDEAPLIRNGGFEQLSGDTMGGAGAVTADNWHMIEGIYGTNAYVNKTSSHEGTKAMAFDSTGVPSGRVFMSQSFAVEEPGRYMLSAYIRKTAGGADLQPELNVWDGMSDHQLAPVALTGQYAYYAKPFTVEGPMNLTVNIGILSGIGQLDFDDVSFERVPDDVEITMDNSDVSGVTFASTLPGSAWDNTKTNAGANKGNFALNTSHDGNASATYIPNIPRTGMYDVYEWHHVTSGSTAAPFTIRHAKGTVLVDVNQTAVTGGKWNLVGSYPFEEGETGSIVITNNFTTATGNFILADGIKLVRTGDVPAQFRNGNFESVSGDPLGDPASIVLTDWQMGEGVYGTNAYMNTTSPYRGAYALTFDSAGAPGGRADMTQSFTVLEPGTYALSAYVKQLDDGTDVRPELAVTDSTGVHLLPLVSLTRQYAYYAQNLLVPAKTDITVSIGIRSGIGKVSFDNVVFARVPDNVDITMDNKDDAGVVFSDASWRNTGVNAGAFEGEFALNTTRGTGASATYTPPIPEAGMYDVFEWHHTTSGPTDAPFTIRDAEGTTHILVDQSKNGAKWNKIGTFPFLPGSAGSVAITNNYLTSNFVLADGIRFVRTGSYAPVTLDHVVLHTNKTVLRAGDTAALTVTGIMSDGSEAQLSDAAVTFSSDSSAATVDPDGLVTANSADEGTVHLSVAVLLGTKTSHASATIVVDNTPPAIVWLGESAYRIDDTIEIGCIAQDTVTAIVHSTCDSGALLAANGYALDPGMHTVSATAVDAAGNERASVFNFTINADYESLSALTAAFVNATGAAGAGAITQSLKQILQLAETAAAGRDGAAARQQLSSYKAAISEQHQAAVLTADQAAALTRWAQELLDGTPLASGAPGKPMLSDTSGNNGLRDGNYTVTMNMWWGGNATLYKLYENGNLIRTANLTDASPNAQQVMTALTGKPNGTYVYTCDLINTFGTSECDPHTVIISDAHPGTPVLSNDNWDHDGTFMVTMNMWWGTNAVRYRLYENGLLLDEQTLVSHMQNAQTASTIVSGRAPGDYRYRAELINAAGTTQSVVMEVTVQ
jgi:hypothetical protein